MKYSPKCEDKQNNISKVPINPCAGAILTRHVEGHKKHVYIKVSLTVAVIEKIK